MLSSRVKVQTSLACWPASNQFDAALNCLGPIAGRDADGTDGFTKNGLYEPLWGHLHTEHVQLVPQCRGLIDEDLCGWLHENYPQTRFRLHANARVQIAHKIIDLCDFGEEYGKQWFADAARVSCRIPDDCIDSRRYPLFMARAVLQALIEEHEQASKGARTP